MKSQCLVDGAWVGEGVDAIHNPATGALIAKVPRFGHAETVQAIEAAEKAFGPWAKTLPKERANILRRWFDLIVANRDDLALIMTSEQGKPLAEARGEIDYAAGFVEFFGEEAKRIYGETNPTFRADSRILVIRQPIGVVAAITPWNFPAAMITRKVAPALAVGCTAVVKPAPETPLTALALAELAVRAGLPAGVLNMLTGDAPAIGKAMCEHPAVRFVGFTGSTEVGKLLMRQAAGTVKKVGLELGGNAPFIVFDDADVDAAVEGAIVSKFRNMGQTCVCANRIYVQDGDLRRLRREARRGGRQAQGRRRDGARRHAGAADQRGGGREGRGACRRRARQGRQGDDRRQAPRARAHLLRADGARGPRRLDADRPRGDLRPGRAGVPLQGRGRGDPPRQRHPISASPPISTPATSAGSGGSPRRSNTAWSASTPAPSRPSSPRSAA